MSHTYLGVCCVTSSSIPSLTTCSHSSCECPPWPDSAAFEMMSFSSSTCIRGGSTQWIPHDQLKALANHPRVKVKEQRRTKGKPSRLRKINRVTSLCLLLCIYLSPDCCENCAVLLQTTSLCQKHGVNLLALRCFPSQHKQQYLVEIVVCMPKGRVPLVDWFRRA